MNTETIMERTNVPTSTSITIIVVIILVALYIGIGPGSQLYNLNKVNDWIEKHQHSWDELVRENPDLEDVDLFGFTGGNGLTGVLVPDNVTDSSELKLYRWINENNPPRPLYVITPNKK